MSYLKRYFTGFFTVVVFFTSTASGQVLNQGSTHYTSADYILNGHRPLTSSLLRNELIKHLDDDSLISELEKIGTSKKKK